MQKNKNITAFLLVTVVAVWGLLAFRIYKTFAGTDNYIPIAHKTLKAVLPKEEGSFELHEYTRDPFLSILTDTVTENIVEAPATIQYPTQRPKPVNLPQYCGIVGNQADKDRIAILRTDKKHLFVKEGEKYDSMKIVSIKEDRLVLDNKGEKITLPLSGQSNKMVSFK
ncbi:MAG: hypothetical protein EOP56_18835 [Sphingobacteriales bacterium]|nr:MAG: hypothetical protein EOP56_18835 [Sphingobacteriales bacterium]